MTPPRPPPKLPPILPSSAGGNDIQGARARSAIAASHEARLAADAELLQRLALEGFTGPGWEQFRAELVKYALGKMERWVLSGKIFAKCKARGFGGLRVIERTKQDAEDLASETVAQALEFFRNNTLMKRRWKPSGGASLKTFFVGACLRIFPNVYNRWFRRARPMEALPRSLEDADGGSRPDHRLQMAAELHDALEYATDDVTREIVMQRAQGYSEAEIAEALKLRSPKAVECRLRRFNERFRQARKRPDPHRAVFPRYPRGGGRAKKRPA